jgi:hydrogenase maturation protease
MGIGNLLLGDDGLGVHAVKALSTQTWPAHVQVIDVGTAFLDALPFLEDAERILIIDAFQGNGQPGTLYTLQLEQCAPKVMHGLHDLDIFGMLAMAKNPHPVQVWVLGIEPARIGWGLELSAPVSAALPTLLNAVLEKIEHMT